MIETIVRERNTGKTREIIGRMRENKESICLVPALATKANFPKDLQGRVFLFSDIENARLRGLTFFKVFVDEGYLFPANQLATFYYKLGKMNKDVVVYGSIENMGGK